jgi:hypothetical protein
MSIDLKGPPEGMPFDSSVAGFATDGMAVGIVVYTLTGHLGHERVGNTNTLRPVFGPEICWSYYSEKGHLTSIGQLLGGLTKTLIVPAAVHGKSVYRREVERRGRDTKVIEFDQAARHYTTEEVMSLVLDDIRTERIGVRPEYEGSRQHEELKSHLSAIEAKDNRMTALQRAFLNGLGWWSAVKQRPKYHCGPANFAIY